MPNRVRLWLCVIVITVLSWIEFQYFSEGGDAGGAIARQIAHVLFMLAIVGIGYYGWSKHPVKWAKQAWLLIYAFVFVLILGVGTLNKLFHFDVQLLDEAHTLRKFFSSPVPFIVLWAISVRGNKA